MPLDEVDRLRYLELRGEGYLRLSIWLVGRNGSLFFRPCPADNGGFFYYQDTSSNVTTTASKTQIAVSAQRR
jgi:hypothetical protein